MAGADTAVGLPLERAAVFIGRIESVYGDTITVAPDPSWSADNLAGAEGEYFFCQVMSGELAGMSFPILHNSGRSLMVASEGEDLSVLVPASSDAVGDAIRIIPYWTPESVFQHTSIPVGTSMRIYDHDETGLGKTPSKVLTYSKTGEWLDANGYSANAYPLRNGRGFFVRLPASVSDLQLDLLGHVSLIPEHQVFCSRGANKSGDLLFALNRPESIGMTEAGLEFADRTMVFTYDGRSKLEGNPSAVYTYYEGYGWVDQIFQPVSDEIVLEPGKAYFVRIPATEESYEWAWTRAPGYLDLL